MTTPPRLARYAFERGCLLARLTGLTDDEYRREPGPAAGVSGRARHWRSTARSAAVPGRSSGSVPTLPLLGICWWVNQELLHHGAEIALLRDLYRAWPR